MQQTLKDLSDSGLLNTIKELKKVEDNSIAELVLYLSEVDARKLYRDLGFPSLFAFCTTSLINGGLGYSEGSAYRRIQAARCLEANPEVYELLRDGKLSLCAVSELYKVIKPENKTQLLELACGKPKTEVCKITALFTEPVAALKKERVRIVPKKVIVENKGPLFSAPGALDTSEEAEEVRFTFTLEVDQEFMDLLKEAKDIIGFVPSAVVIKKVLREFVVKKKAAPRSVSVKAKEPKATYNLSRYVPKAVAYRVRERDQHQCTFISPDGRRCAETCGLQLDHIEPFALGGTNEVSNLRLLCPAHNQLFAEKSFGREKIESYFQRRA